MPRLAALSLALFMASCHREAGPSRPPTPEVAVAPVAAAGLQLDVRRMAADIGVLAADEFRGRYTLSPDLQRAAEFLVRRYGELGLQPCGPGFAVDFPLRTGARLSSPARLELVRGKRATAMTEAEFVVLPQSGSGVVQGELVFVGYAAVSEPAEMDTKADGEATKKEDTRGASGSAAGGNAVDGSVSASAPAYDDLAGIDVKGKVALVLLEAPGRPDPMAMFTRMREESEAFATVAAPLKAAKDVAGLKKLHAEARGRLLAMVEAYVPASATASVWPLPEDVLAVEYDLNKVASGLMRAAAKLPGPQFGFSAGSVKAKVERLVKAGAVGVIVVRGPRSFLSAGEREADELPTLASAAGGRLPGEPLAVPVVQMKWKRAEQLLGKPKLSKLQAQIDAEKRPHSRALGLTVSLAVAVEPVTIAVPNVLASLSGGDLKQEIVMIGAHYDHIGVEGLGQCGAAGDDKICNGADDNASGTAMVLELARAWKQSGRTPRRTIVFTHFAGEELGVLGSKALAEALPFGDARVVAMVNLDMVGRLGPKGLAIGGLGSSDAWMPLLDKLGSAGLEILYEGSVATRSDHASFYRKDIPVLFFFTGVHSDYHRPGDHADKINLVGMTAIGEIVGGVMLALGDGLAVPWKPAGPQGGLSQGLPGSDPKTVIKRVKAADAS
ncbi:MAG: M20/M25/M40 family metallo-hydrolase [Nannocystis sp.]|uniref:M20/M25/M40 family metallo-hydrolase n=1 Tax=Nannocystis sp. TaxID=1962667 RepID=UPI002426FEE3|nr:M20/M25/M40 family metallo-hydrolase [Nannocystis sp.]MBK9753201.1 M20/M25/M40 family metallo-hydrolase [Nannocystis sp.]